MSIAVILALVDGGAGSKAALEAAVGLGRRFEARVDFLHVEPDAESAVPVMGEGLSGAAVEQIIESIKAEGTRRLEAAKALYEEHCAKAGLPTVEPDDKPEPGKFAVAFRHVVGREAEEIKRRGRLADLIILSRPKAAGEGSAPGFDTALFDSGRPLLLVPSDGSEKIGGCIAIAWDRSREATRAVDAALPFLVEAEKVVILSAREGKAKVEPSQLSWYLAGHGIAAKTWAFTPEGGALGEELLAEAAKAGADLMIMGGYGHSRLRELVLGGATREVLQKAAIPVLMAH